MEMQKTEIEGCFIITPKVFEDERGYFFESYNQKKLEELLGVRPNFVQDNESLSTKGVLRGLHYQQGEHAQAKLVRVIEGEVLDVAVDIRPDSKTFGKVVSTILSSDNRKQMFIPRGCAHGFLTLSETARFAYKCDNFYNVASESGIIYNDPTLNIDWMLPEEELIISAKDKELPSFKMTVPN
ncbi:dTDP-4-dehydrorhamnose 3,5-epimerase [Flagellimonas nanhaiensis]|uniref:dTDP-4-dehydrorhamnose 3,5-epimerase n=1 Tax=Flagellimonas nanhaiensis TaxID=2292706 RepID=A0A371JLH8_9FLAO|nr:dTDP-4-dehydrorhamnose 3,5-epimerase [Allomuricauda nanhaiensis]RDY57862.1 dTDP-4-dehydrorhamnose 3,5-epimerase [Allomuricauda nanhaiensis]